DDPQKELPEHPQEAVARCALVALLLRRQLRRCTHRDHPPVHRTAADATLTAQRTPTASPLSFPGLKAEACRAPGQCGRPLTQQRIPVFRHLNRFKFPFFCSLETFCCIPHPWPFGKCLEKTDFLPLPPVCANRFFYQVAVMLLFNTRTR